MAARAAMQAQMDALMGKERDIAVDKVRAYPSPACTQARAPACALRGEFVTWVGRAARSGGEVLRVVNVLMCVGRWIWCSV